MSSDSNACARRRIDRLGILPVTLVQLQDVPGIDSLEPLQTVITFLS